MNIFEQHLYEFSLELYGAIASYNYSTVEYLVNRRGTRVYAAHFTKALETGNEKLIILLDSKFPDKKALYINVCNTIDPISNCKGLDFYLEKLVCRFLPHDVILSSSMSYSNSYIRNWAIGRADYKRSLMISGCHADKSILFNIITKELRKYHSDRYGDMLEVIHLCTQNMPYDPEKSKLIIDLMILALPNNDPAVNAQCQDTTQ